MPWFHGVVAYTIIWWTVLFAVLPWGVRTAEEEGAALEPGQVHSAPMRPRLVAKFIVTTLISTAIFAIYYYVQSSGWISFRHGG